MNNSSSKAWAQFATGIKKEVLSFQIGNYKIYMNWLFLNLLVGYAWRFSRWKR